MIALAPLAISFLKKNWLYIAIGIAVISLYAYIKLLNWQVDHYKEKFNLVKVEFNAYKKEIKEKEEAYTSSIIDLQLKYNKVLEEKQEQVDKNSKLVQERIKRDKEVAAILLSNSTVGLFNASKPEPRQPEAPKTDTGNAETASTNHEAVKTLQQLLLVSAANDENHQKCINALQQWQAWWKDFENIVDTINAAP